MEKYINNITNQVLKFSGTPFYMYDSSSLFSTISKIKKSLPKKSSIFFASMANDNTEIWNLLRSNNIKLFATSVYHVKTALQNGFSPNEVLFSSPNISDEEFSFFNKNRIKYTLNSIDQVKQCIRCKKKERVLKVGIRLNINDFNENGASAYLGMNSRFGIFKEDFEELMKLCTSNNLVINGLQIFIGTNVMFHPRFLAFYNSVFQFAEELDNLDYIDLGGGFGVPYKYPRKRDFDWHSFSSELSILLSKYAFLRKINLFFEPGRSLIARSGYFVTKVSEVLERNGKFFIISDSSVSIFPRPHIYPDAFHFVSVVSKSGKLNRKKIYADICGNTIYSKDILAKNIKINMPNIGDYLVFHDAGAYCYSMRSNFLGVTFPKQYLVSKEKVIEI